MASILALVYLLFGGLITMAVTRRMAVAVAGGRTMAGGPSLPGILDRLVQFAFGVATVVTNKGFAMAADRIRTTPSTYTTSPKFVAAGVGATGAARTAVAADTALSSELAEGRTSGTESVVTTTQTGDTYQVTGTVTATGTRACDEGGLFDASTVGNMYTSATYAVINLVSGDSIAFTWKVKYA